MTSSPSQEAIEEFVPADDDLEDVLSDVQRALTHVSSVDIDVTEPADLDRVRQALPTEPHRARLVHAGLPEPLRYALEYVEPSERQSGYWRKSRERSDPAALSDAELEARYAFIEAGMAERGTDGVVRTGDGRVIARAADNIGDRITNREFAHDDPDEEKGQGILDRILKRI